MDDIYMVFLTIVMPIVTVLVGAWRIKKTTREMIDEYVETFKTEAIETFQKPEFAVLLQSIGKQLAQGMMEVGGKEIKQAMPKIKLNDLIMTGAMKMLGGGGLGNLLGGLGEQGQPSEGSNSGSSPKGKLE